MSIEIQPTAQAEHQHNEPTLVGIQTCLEQVFPDSATRPSLRTFHKWKTAGFLPYLRIGKRIFFDPVKVRKALDKQFEILTVNL